MVTQLMPYIGMIFKKKKKKHPKFEYPNNLSKNSYFAINAIGKSKKMIIGLCHGYDFTKRNQKSKKVALDRPDRIEMVLTMVANAS